MADIVNIYDAKTRLSRLVDRAAAGENVFIARAGKPVAWLVAVEDAGPRHPGLLRGVTVPDAAFAPHSEDELAAWE